ncbi:DUF4178 domain-containing protein [Pseudorhodoferax sp. Leaf267]|uniref:DUF4178 domain-containing protein n=1 Tax=Pseudorhodoferax sp. Leaf267 TaxID=1736316 RepID=UPI0006F6D2B6|nr:DUF4178 domain-containing protein [Pseudorhodoferax sp. Leaf267]KQP18398.1 hypothetical protein ASF43_11360 [Pseudorhodoferax sp. Leaf267]
MADDTPQRTYRAPCPGCGAPVEFRHAQSTHAVCAYCQSTVVRDGEVLCRVGRVAELFDDHSPLQLHARGRWQGQDFTLIGRLQYRAPTGTWTEWEALLADGSMATLGEDNGAYVWSRAATLQSTSPSALKHRVGTTVSVDGTRFSVAANDQAVLLSAQGELPHLPPLNQPFDMVELRNDQGEVLSIDFGRQPPGVSRGHAVLLDDLKLTGLREGAVREERARQFACPSCGAPVQITLATTKTVTCTQCSAIIDVASGTGGELRHALQHEPLQPLIALGSIGHLEGVAWQVVGFQHRMGWDPAEPDERFGWSEYLLYNAKRGFAFLVDSVDGWSMVKPTTGAPKLAGNKSSAGYLGSRYELREAYEAKTDYVAGEFYWPVQRGQKTKNRDFAKGRTLLSMEQTATEITWSSGSQLNSDTVAQAFKLKGRKDLFQRSDAAPLSAAAGVSRGTIVTLVIVLLVVMVIMSSCNDCDPSRENCNSTSSRSSGGSYGGFSTGGGHK